MTLDYSQLSFNEKRTYHLQRMSREDLRAWLEANPIDFERIARAMAKRDDKARKRATIVAGARLKTRFYLPDRWETYSLEEVIDELTLPA
jgi:hypothetical protein